MSLLDSIKSLLGLDREERTPSGETRVTVERERGGAEPATAAENAVKGTDADGVDTATEGEEPARADEPAAETDASASTGSLVDEDAGIEPGEAVAEADTDTGPAAEPAEAAGPVADEPGEAEADVEPEDDTGEPEATEAPDDDATTGAETDTGDATGGAFDGPDAGEPTDSVRGIGPSYAERLAGAGVETVGDLANAEPAALSEETGVSEKRLAGWVEQARERLE